MRKTDVNTIQLSNWLYINDLPLTYLNELIKKMRKKNVHIICSKFLFMGKISNSVHWVKLDN